MTPDEAIATATEWYERGRVILDYVPAVGESLIAEIERLRARVRKLELIYKVLPTLEATLCSCRANWGFRSYVPGDIRTPCDRCIKLYAAKQELADLQKGKTPCRA